MPFLVTFALRNLARHRRRTLITAGALALGLGAFLFFDSILQGADSLSERNLVWYETGGARIVAPARVERPDQVTLADLLTPVDQVRAVVEDLGWSATPRTRFAGELTTEAEVPASRLVVATGVDRRWDPTVFLEKDVRLTGAWFESGEGGVVLGAWLAEDLRLGLDDVVTLTTRTVDGSYQVLDLVVRGLVETPDPQVNRSGVFLDLAGVDEALGLAGGVTEVAVGWPLGTEEAEGRARLAAALEVAGLEVGVLSWKDLAGSLVAVMQAKRGGSGFILFLVVLIVAVGVGNTFLLAFYERKTEIGMLRALGMGSRTLMRAYLIEAAGIGVIGTTLGLAFGAVVVTLAVTVGLDFSVLARKTDIGYPISGLLYGVWNPGSFAVAGALGIALTTVLVIGPTRRALRLPITESLRSES